MFVKVRLAVVGRRGGRAGARARVGVRGKGARRARKKRCQVGIRIIV